MDIPSLLQYLAIALLLLMGALFSSMEMSVSTVNRLRLRMLAEKGVKRAQVALSIIERYDKALYTILIGNNVVNIAASALATLIFTQFLGPSGAVAATVLMTVLVLTFGEILPKTYGKYHNESIILSLGSFLSFVMAVLTPFTWVFMKMRNLLSSPGNDGPTVTEEDLHYLIDTVEEEGVIEEYERDLVRSALEFNDIDIKDILTPRVNMVSLSIDAEPEVIKQIILGEGYSRIPVYEENIDDITGILYSRDYLRAILSGDGNVDLKSILAKPCFVHRSMKLSGLLPFFKSKKVNVAIVTDDYGGTVGMITTQDIIEELVGDLWDDEDGDEPVEFVKLDEDNYEILGSCYLRDMAEEPEWEDFEFEGDHSTVNGWAMQIFGHIPQVGESKLHKGLILNVMAIDGNRIQKLKLTKTHDNVHHSAAPDNSRDGGTDDEGDSSSGKEDH